MTVRAKPARWQGSDDAIRAVQVAFDVEEAVLEAVRKAAFDRHVSTSDQIRQVLGLTTTAGPKRPRLTVSLGAADYEFLAARYGLAADDRLAIKERATRDLIAFAGGGKAAAKNTTKNATKNAMKSTAKSAAKSAPEGVKQSARTVKPARR